MASRRLESVDFLRGLAVASMFVTHAIVFTAPRSDDPILRVIAINLSGDWGAGLFGFLMGLSLSLSIDGHRRHEMPERRIAARILRRAAALFGFGFLFPIAVWGLVDGLYWDILTTLAAALVLLCLLRNARPAVLYALAGAVVLLSPVLFELAGGAARWATGNYKAPIGLANLAGGYLATGYFPIFPWIAFPLIGFGVGRTLPSLRATWLAALGSAALGALLWHVHRLGPLSRPLSYVVAPLKFYPLSVPFFLLILGIVFSLFAFARRAFDVPDRRTPEIFRTLSRYAFTLYVLHYAAYVLPQRIAGWWLTGNPEAFLRNTLTTPVALALGFLLIPVYYGLCRAWDRVEGRFGLEWWMARIVDGAAAGHVSVRVSASGDRKPLRP